MWRRGQTIDEFLDDLPTVTKAAAVAANSFSDHECRTVPEAGLADQKNGRLLLLAQSADFDIFLAIG